MYNIPTLNYFVSSNESEIVIKKYIFHFDFLRHFRLIRTVVVSKFIVKKKLKVSVAAR